MKLFVYKINPLACVQDASKKEKTERKFTFLKFTPRTSLHNSIAFRFFKNFRLISLSKK